MAVATLQPLSEELRFRKSVVSEIVEDRWPMAHRRLSTIFLPDHDRPWGDAKRYCRLPEVEAEFMRPFPEALNQGLRVLEGLRLQVLKGNPSERQKGNASLRTGRRDKLDARRGLDRARRSLGLHKERYAWLENGQSSNPRLCGAALSPRRMDSRAESAYRSRRGTHCIQCVACKT